MVYGKEKEGKGGTVRGGKSRGGVYRGTRRKAIVGGGRTRTIRIIIVPVLLIRPRHGGDCPKTIDYLTHILVCTNRISFYMNF